MLRFENKGKLGELPNLDLNLKYFFYKIGSRFESPWVIR